MSNVFPLFSTIPIVPERIRCGVEAHSKAKCAEDDGWEEDAVPSGKSVVERVGERHGGDQVLTSTSTSTASVELDHCCSAISSILMASSLIRKTGVEGPFRACSSKILAGSRPWHARFLHASSRRENTTPVGSTQNTKGANALLSLAGAFPPRPPPGTYPHPFPEGRDDPETGSMRLSYKRDVEGAKTTTEDGKYVPLYVVHVKSTSNNTIISLHAPSTPRLHTIARAEVVLPGAKPRPSEAAAAQAFSVNSNPDAEPTSESIERTEETQFAVMASQVPLAMTANRCIGWASGGSCHYKKVNRSTYEAGYAASIRIIRRIEEAFRFITAGGRIEDIAPMKEGKKDEEKSEAPLHGGKGAQNTMRIRVVYTGFGIGRDAFNAAVLSGEGNFVRGLIAQVQDKTPIKIGGCRARKARRV